MPKVEYQQKPTGVSPASPVKPEPYAPEVQAKIDEFTRKIGGAMIEALRKKTTADE